METSLYKTGFRASWTELCPAGTAPGGTPPAGAPGGGPGGGAPGGGAGPFYVRSDEFKVRLDTLDVVNNTATASGGGIYLLNQARRLLLHPRSKNCDWDLQCI